MSDSYIRIATDEAKRLADQTIEVVGRLRNQRIHRRHRFWSWLPFWKPLTKDQARLYLARSGDLALLYWRQQTRAEAILNLIKSAGSDPFVYICSEDLERIQFGQTYEELSLQS